MDLFKTPGSNLTGTEKVQFDEIKPLINNATNEMLLRPDWDANIRIVDLVNAMNNQTAVNEVVFLLRKKLGSGQPQIVFLTLTLIETLVKNCGTSVHVAINESSFINTMGKVARKYNAKSGSENGEVANLCLDIIQAWGEAFAPYKQRFPNIIKLYQDLLKERLPFSPQADKSRIPIFGVPASQSTSNSSFPTSSKSVVSNTFKSSIDTTVINDDDANLAAALAASLTDLKVAKTPAPSVTAVNSRTSSQYNSTSTSRTQRLASSTETASKSNVSSTANSKQSKNNELIESVSTHISILSEMITAAVSINDLLSYDSSSVWNELLNQLMTLLTQLVTVIEEAVISNPEGLDELIMINDKGQCIVSIYEKLRKNNGTYSLSQAKSELPKNLSTNEISKSEASLLDFDSSSIAVSTVSKNTSYVFPPPKPLVAPNKGTASVYEDTMGMFAMAYNDLSPSVVHSQNISPSTNLHSYQENNVQLKANSSTTSVSAAASMNPPPSYNASPTFPSASSQPNKSISQSQPQSYQYQTQPYSSPTISSSMNSAIVDHPNTSSTQSYNSTSLFTPASNFPITQPPQSMLYQSPTGNNPALSTSANAVKVSTAIIDDPFGPSTSSSIDSLLLSSPVNMPSHTYPEKVNMAAASANTQPGIFDPFNMGYNQAVPLASNSNNFSSSKTVDPLDGLLSIATRSNGPDEFDTYVQSQSKPSTQAPSSMHPIGFNSSGIQIFPHSNAYDNGSPNILTFNSTSSKLSISTPEKASVSDNIYRSGFQSPSVPSAPRFSPPETQETDDSANPFNLF